MSDIILQLDNVAAGYGETQILNHISLSVRKGERLAVIGRNGVGKTTMLNTVMGLTQLHGGQIRLNGAEIGRLPAHRRAELGLGLVPQTRDIFPSLTVEENLLAGLRNGGNLDAAYALFPRLKERRKNGGAQLSGGEQQMLAIARTLMGRPTLLLLDEPLEGLAPVICESLMATFEHLADDDRHTIVLVEQHTDLALEFADRVVILDNGEIVHDGSAAGIAAKPEILERHVGVGLHTPEPAQ